MDFGIVVIEMEYSRFVAGGVALDPESMQNHSLSWVWGHYVAYF